ncbi:hypothetical protein [Streptomyces sp. SLBN-118]|uniref:hypothetical protein n=1 Tax=Streptomyces sp. SLBN-118 TaxID=2768454 RepID=UPI00114EC227|nr:hypothetical protein [Streptomyces sp. SLBN-118]
MLEGQGVLTGGRLEIHHVQDGLEGLLAAAERGQRVPQHSVCGRTVRVGGECYDSRDTADLTTTKGTDLDRK